MLSWTQHTDGWYASGFRIELRGPFNWVLVDVDSEDGSPQAVSTDLEPLAAERTLSECKREAEILAAARQRSLLRRSHARILLITLAGMVLMFGQSVMTNTFVLLAGGFVALRSLGIVLQTLTWNNVGAAHEVFYQ